MSPDACFENILHFLDEGHALTLQMTITRAYISATLIHIDLATWQSLTQSVFVLVTLRILFLEKGV